MVIPVEFLIQGFTAGFLPQLGLADVPLLAGEAAVQTRGAVFCNHCGLNGDGARAAEGIHKVVPATIPGKIHHGGGESFPQRRIIPHGTVAALVEACAGGVQKQLGLILHNGELKLIQAAGFRHPAHMIFLSQTLGRGLFHNGLTVGDGVELGAQAVPLYRECTIFWNNGL